VAISESPFLLINVGLRTIEEVTDVFAEEGLGGAATARLASALRGALTSGAADTSGFATALGFATRTVFTDFVMGDVSG
jgi:hypothetical protein